MSLDATSFGSLGTVDLPAIANVLRTGDVYVSSDLFGPDAEASVTTLSDNIQASIDSTLADPAMKEALGVVKVVVVSRSEQNGQFARDIGQALLDNTDADTVVVDTQAGRHNDTVSTSISRARIEKNLPKLSGEQSAESIESYLHAIAEPESTLAVNSLTLTAVIVTVLISTWAALITFPHVKKRSEISRHRR
ncbi:hypothetical protein GC425_00520 [Corynebacterium sp. zg254]|uniref:Membrane transport protein MMPL domain-containing protein n=1 Tax=Corynebacterium zhongnanshanii TaxID=2768834 RepID=A0ABQ6VGF4_9CORY|nr:MULTISPECIES: DUF6676 family protein [Corynebacterium]KAB3523495.1 hypothetical protein F8377_05110 [Corynebacterium zhongnanshanii]MCR5913359.1 hypothetical protein [Corynebacterium sp. zg254]